MTHLTTTMPLPDRIDQAITQHARRQPDASAIEGETRMSYAELSARAQTVAQRLQDAGTRRESRVAVVMPRSPDFVVAALGIMMAGAAYVPLDPNDPPARLRLILDQAHCKVVVTIPGVDASWLNARTVLVINDATGLGPQAEEPESADETGAVADQLAYILFTSGSSGEPKGVEVTHGSVLSLLTRDDRIVIAPAESAVALAPVSFDASVFEIWGALCHGGTAVFYPLEGFSVSTMVNLLERWQPDWIFLTTALLHLLADHAPEAFSAVGSLIAGGDVLSPRHVLAAANFPRRRMFAAYGPTETTVYASLHEVRRNGSYERVPIGRPLTGTTFSVIGDDLKEVRQGEIGKLVIGGDKVARGYCGLPRATALRFVPDWLSGQSGGRLYLTGDLVRQLDDGEYEFHGRLDRQVKLRGHRVELDAIESCLRDHPAVGDAAVRVFGYGADDKRLVTYASLAEEETTVSQLSAWLRERLPTFMQPSAIVVGGLPIDRNGKLDRARLEPPWRGRDELDVPDYAAPVTPLQALVATTWADVLELDRVGIDDPFFEIGGDSLRSVEVIARLRREGVKITAAQFLDHPTVRALTEHSLNGRASGGQVMATTKEVV